MGRQRSTGRSPWRSGKCCRDWWVSIIRGILKHPHVRVVAHSGLGKLVDNLLGIPDSPGELDRVFGSLLLLVGSVAGRGLVVGLLNVDDLVLVRAVAARLADIETRKRNLGLVEADTRRGLHLLDGALGSVDTVVAAQVPEGDVLVRVVAGLANLVKDRVAATVDGAVLCLHDSLEARASLDVAGLRVSAEVPE